MKIKPGHYAHIVSAFRPFADKIPAHREALKSDSRVKDLEKRLRWDVSYAAKLTPWICAELYPYLDDNHVDTAFKAAMREIES